MLQENYMSILSQLHLFLSLVTLYESLLLMMAFKIMLSQRTGQRAH